MKALPLLILSLPLYAIALYLFLPGDAKNKLFYRDGYRYVLGQIEKNRHSVVLLLSFLAIHLTEVHIDGFFTSLVGDFTWVITGIEADLIWNVRWVSQTLIPLSYFMAGVYIIIHPIMIGFIPAFLLLSDGRLLKGFSYSYLIMYLISLPFYLFFPVKNVFTYYGNGEGSIFLEIFDDIKKSWYHFTTENNCFPSLHVAAALIICYFVYLYWKEGKGQNGNIFFILISIYTITVIFGVVYLTIHWLTDVLGGFAVAGLAIYLGKRYTDGVCAD